MRLSLLSAGALAAVVGLTPALIRAQAGGAAPAQRKTASSSLQGIWNYSSLTPVERPAEFAGKPTLTPQEAAAYVKTLTDRNNTDRRDVSTDTDVARGYNNFWWDRGSGLVVVDGWARTSLVSDPADGRIPSLTPDGQRRQNERNQARAEHPADGPEDRSLAERCLSFNAGPPMLPGPYNNYVQILEFTDRVVISNEMIHDARIVSLTRREHLPQRSAGIRATRSANGTAGRSWWIPRTSPTRRTSAAPAMRCTWSSASPALTPTPSCTNSP